MIITSAPATARVSGSVTVPSMAATPDPDCAAAVPAATNSINSAEATARGSIRERHREIIAESKYFWVVTTVLLIIGRYRVAVRSSTTTFRNFTGTPSSVAGLYLQ